MVGYKSRPSRVESEVKSEAMISTPRSNEDFADLDKSDKYSLAYGVTA